MAEASNNTNVISKHHSGFPEYLDFTSLRAEGINYLGRLSGKIWTDHNVHDPGITVLESLCYALLDLGYRTNLPTEDILARRQAGEKDDNFFSPAQILGCNPLTITDYRKLLIDIDGVRNAWLQIDTSKHDFCRNDVRDYYNNYNKGLAQDYLNGLYQVLIEPETDSEEARKQTAKKVKEALMAHRNFCEDFTEIRFLCTLSVGVCADIDLEENADPEETFRLMLEQLNNYFSPAPRFYTLPQMLDKGLPIEDIFAGRPYSSESHGFIDTMELEQLELRKEIHLSDVYNTIFSVPGIRQVRDLRLKKCGEGAGGAKWSYRLPENHVLRFSPACSGFRLTRNGILLNIDTNKYSGTEDGHSSGKALYKMPSPYLDATIPTGTYRSDLADYYSIQNDFPRVYGIAEGGLPDSATTARKAQALQLKGYLFFFDQLLANYLGQLKNIRSLFAFTGAASGEHTYFLNGTDSVPELGRLLRFGENGISSPGEGETLAVPVPKLELELALADTGSIDPESFSRYSFSGLAVQQTAIELLRQDLESGAFVQGLLNEDSNNISFYLVPASGDFALVSKITYSDAISARFNCSSMLHAATFSENYRTFITADSHASFSIELSIGAFNDYLQLIVEDKAQYAERRNLFLDHLLSRFAEKFTDYALLSYNQSSAPDARAAIQAKEQFLGRYDELSSGRGQGYDYLKNNWNNDNQSGFEREVRYLSGMEEKLVMDLCHFVVEAYDDQYLVNLDISSYGSFRLQEKFDTKGDAQEAAQAAFMALAKPENLGIRYSGGEKNFRLQLQYAPGSYAVFTEQYSTSQQADATKDYLHRLFAEETRDEDIFVSDYRFGLELSDADGQLLYNAKETHETQEETLSARKKLVPALSDPALWNKALAAGKHTIGSLHGYKNTAEEWTLVDTRAFKIDINNTIVGRPDKYSYDVLDQNNSFRFYPLQEFDKRRDAETHAQDTLLLATDETAYRISKNEESQRYALQLVRDGNAEAASYDEYASEAEAQAAKEQVLSTVRPHQYRLSARKMAHRWKYRYELGYRDDACWVFHSNAHYTDKEEARKAATEFAASLPSLQLRDTKNVLNLGQARKNAVVSIVREEGRQMASKETVEQLLREQQAIAALIRENKTEAFDRYVSREEISRDGRYVYRLVDKNKVLAAYDQLFTDAVETAEAKARISRKAKNASFLELLRGGDLYREIKDENSGAISYRYQVKARNYSYTAGPQQGNPLVLLESASWYPSKEDAATAFEENFFRLLALASDTASYGTQLAFGEEENTEAVAFVPKATIEEFGDEKKTIEKLVALAQSYPIKEVRMGSAAFYAAFPCEEKTEQPEDPCSPDYRVKVYYFRLPGSGEDLNGWQSLKYYYSHADAEQDFRQFLRLTHFPGNFYIDCDDCSQPGKGTAYRIFIREVLAESSRRFATAGDAWGPEGVERFTWAVQSCGAFHQYQKKDGCCYSFYVTCGPGLLLHPHKYDTPEQRNGVLEQLYKRFMEFYGKDIFRISWEKDRLVFSDRTGQPFAYRELDETEQQRNACELQLDIVARMQRSSNITTQKEGRLLLLDDQGQIVVVSMDNNLDPADWKATIEEFALCYPILPATEQQGSQRYALALKLPAADSQPGHSKYETVWQSSCAYGDCVEADVALRYALTLLRDSGRYLPVQDCSCNSFGIALHHDGDAQDTSGWIPGGTTIAYNPQCYPTPALVCEAVERTKKRSNAEGLHVVEHILLRPLQEEDCACRREMTPCEHGRCTFEWTEHSDDPCEDGQVTLFKPGSDIFSFIATVVLPSWPQRFRSPGARDAMEQLLYRNAPSHVLLRILWLAPHEFCAFETAYKRWHRWLAGKQSCGRDFSTCYFLTGLLRLESVCPGTGTDCQPCNGNDNAADDPCFGAKRRSNALDCNAWLQQINQVYCLNLVENPTAGVREQPAAPDTVAAAVVAPPAKKSTAGTSRKSEARTALKPKPQFVNSRFARYRTNVEHVLENTNGHPVAIKVQRYLNDSDPAPAKTETLIAEIIANKKVTGHKALNQNQVLDLLKSVTAYSLDKICFGEEKDKSAAALAGAFEKIRKSKADTGSLYNYWDALDVKKYEPELDTGAIKKMLTGKK